LHFDKNKSKNSEYQQFTHIFNIYFQPNKFFLKIFTFQLKYSFYFCSAIKTFNLKTKIMKKVKSLLAIASLAFGMFLMNACSDPCKDVECLNGGICDEGDCICAAGYEGTDCAVEMRTKFIGSYTIVDSCEPQSRTSTISTSSSDVKKVLISNIIDATLGGTAVAEIDGTKITIAQQNVTDSASNIWSVKGINTGTFANNSFQITVQFVYGTQSIDCNLTFSKQ